MTMIAKAKPDGYTKGGEELRFQKARMREDGKIFFSTEKVIQKKGGFPMRNRITKREFLKLTGLAVAAAGTNLSFLSEGVRAQGVTNLVMGTAGTQGTWYPMSAGLAAVINKHDKKYNLTIVATPRATDENLFRVNKGEFQFGWADPGSLYNAYHGLDKYKEKHKLLGWMTAHKGFQIIVALADTGAKRIIDFKGKKVSVGSHGGSSQRHAKIIFPAHGLNWDDFTPKFMEIGQTLDLMKNKLLDGFIYSWGRSSAGLKDLATSRKLNWLPIEKDAAPKILKVFPYFQIGKLNRGDYYLDDPPEMVTWTYQIFCRADLPEELVYDLTKAVFGHLDEVHPITMEAKELKLENQLRDMVIPVHPGALKYYKEKGVAK
ncbi:MAG: TAXI family TRAP transporter solute-binding subunit [Pseudomonadota bacterium]